MCKYKQKLINLLTSNEHYLPQKHAKHLALIMKTYLACGILIVILMVKHPLPNVNILFSYLFWVFLWSNKYINITRYLIMTHYLHCLLHLPYYLENEILDNLVILAMLLAADSESCARVCQARQTDPHRNPLRIPNTTIFLVEPLQLYLNEINLLHSLFPLN